LELFAGYCSVKLLWEVSDEGTYWRTGTAAYHAPANRDKQDGKPTYQAIVELPAAVRKSAGRRSSVALTVRRA